jgi:hypothetical protein
MRVGRYGISGRFATRVALSVGIPVGVGLMLQSASDKYKSGETYRKVTERSQATARETEQMNRLFGAAIGLKDDTPPVRDPPAAKRKSNE